mgnify:CR=1 FL=1
MIDYWNNLITDIYNLLKDDYPNIPVLSRPSNRPARYPAVYITQSDNAEIADSRIATREEQGALLVFDIHVYSNLQISAGEQVKTIMKVIGDRMRLLGFVRGSFGFNDVLDDNTVLAHGYSQFSGVLDRYGYIHSRR